MRKIRSIEKCIKVSRRLLLPLNRTSITTSKVENYKTDNVTHLGHGYKHSTDCVTDKCVALGEPIEASKATEAEHGWPNNYFNYLRVARIDMSESVRNEEPKLALPDV